MQDEGRKADSWAGLMAGSNHWGSGSTAATTGSELCVSSDPVWDPVLRKFDSIFGQNKVENVDLGVPFPVSAGMVLHN